MSDLPNAMLIAHDNLVIIWARSDVLVLRGTFEKHTYDYALRQIIAIQARKLTIHEIKDIFMSDGYDKYDIPQHELMGILFERMTGYYGNLMV